MLDRIDLFVQVPRVDYAKLMSDNSTEPTAAVRDRVEAARQRQRERFAGALLACNADMTAVEARQFCQVDQASQGLLQVAMKQFQLSARGFHRILKVSRATADRSAALRAGVAEALQYWARGLG